MDEQFNSAFVTPVVEQNTEVTGCNSRDVTSNEQVFSKKKKKIAFLMQ